MHNYFKISTLCILFGSLEFCTVKSDGHFNLNFVDTFSSLSQVKTFILSFTNHRYYKEN